MISQFIKNKLDNVLNENGESFNIPGMTVLISQNNQVVYERYYGARNIEERLPVTKDTVFGLASLTKSLTSCIVMMLQAKGKLNTTDSVSTWIPELKWPDDKYSSMLTVGHLLSHTSGLPGLPVIHNARLRSITEDPDGSRLFSGRVSPEAEWIDSPDDLIKALNTLNITLLGQPGAVFNYSNEGYGLLQVIIEKAAGMPFTEYVAEQLFEPLGMKDSYFHTSSLDGLDNVTELYAKDQGQVFHSPHWWDVGDIYTNGSWKASTRDVMIFVEALRQKHIPGVSDAGINDMTAPFVSLKNGGSYGFGIEINPIGGYTRYGHGGSIKGVSSNFQVIKEKDVSAVILVNMADVPAEKILVSMLEILLQVPKSHPMNAPEVQMEGLDLSKYTGRYTSDEGYEAVITYSGHTLCLQRFNDETIFYPVSEHDFISTGGERIYFDIASKRVRFVMIGKRVLVKN